MKLTTTTVGKASQLLSAILFVDLETERYYAYFNPRAANPISGGLGDFLLNYPSRPLPLGDDFQYDDY
jgi:hypothetical protein